MTINLKNNSFFITLVITISIYLMLMDLIVNKKIDLKKLTLFLESLVEGKIFFRYFNKRPLTQIYKNFFTIVVQENNEYIGYGHLEKEKGICWLGICVSDKAVGRQIGQLIIDNLILEAEKNNIDIISLSVDKTNFRAQIFYEKNNFKRNNAIKFEDSYIYQLKLN